MFLFSTPFYILLRVSNHLRLPESFDHPFPTLFTLSGYSVYPFSSFPSHRLPVRITCREKGWRVKQMKVNFDSENDMEEACDRVQSSDQLKELYITIKSYESWREKECIRLIYVTATVPPLLICDWTENFCPAVFSIVYVSRAATEAKTLSDSLPGSKGPAKGPAKGPENCCCPLLRPPHLPLFLLLSFSSERFNSWK